MIVADDTYLFCGLGCLKFVLQEQATQRNNVGPVGLWLSIE